MKESTMSPNSKMSLSWDSYEKSICNGFGLLQQRGEFVDMTLAADGHHVKVHQLVMSLVSPFIKDLITSANCPHPVIFLNKVSYDTLQAILEYAYTGEVLVAPERLVSFLGACRDLHVKGLQDITLQGNGKNLLQLITKRNAPDPLDPLSETSQVNTPLRTGIKRRKMEEVEVPVEYLHTDDTYDKDMLSDEMPNDDGDETQYEDDEIPYDDDQEQILDCNETDLDVKHEIEIQDVKYSDDIRMEDRVIDIEPYKAGSRWVCRDGYFYVFQRTKGHTTYLRCGSDKCPAHWKMSKKIGAGPIISNHNHPPTPWVPNRNAMFQALKRRATTEKSMPLNAIYEEEAARYQDAAPHLPFESVAPSMRKWRRSGKPVASRSLQSMG